MKFLQGFASCMILILTLITLPVTLEASANINDIVRANDLYSEKKYTASAQAYEALIHKGVRNGYLYYNLGNTYIRLGKTGPAILNYVRAQKLIPRDENLQANLKFAIQQTQDKIEPPSPPLLFWVHDFNLNELVNGALILNLIFWTSLTLWMYFRSYPFAVIRNVFLGLLLLSILSIGFKIKSESDLKLGVILTKSVDVKSGHAEDAVTLFQLHEGALVTVTSKAGNWAEVRLNKDQKGWVPQNSLGT